MQIKEKIMDESQQMAQLEKLIRLLNRFQPEEDRSITVPVTKQIAKALGMKFQTVQNKLKEEKYTIISWTSLESNFFAQTGDLDKLFQNLQIFFKSNPRDQYSSQMANVWDLYSYLARMNNKTVAQVQMMDTQKLRNVFDVLRQSHGIANALPMRYFREIEIIAVAFFKDDESRRKYDNVLKRKQLDGILSEIAELPDGIKTNRYFAEGCIREIQKVFPDEDAAIFVYNSCGKLPPESIYEKESTDIKLMCSCGTLNRFPSMKQAHQGKCSNCGTALFMKCPKCGKPVLNGVASCGNCGFFMAGLQMFDSHVRKCEEAIKLQKLSEAKAELEAARACNPSADIKSLEMQVRALEGVLERKMQQIETAFGDGNLNKAKKLISDLRKERPGIDLSEYDKKIDKKLEWAQREFSQCAKMKLAGDKISKCIMILQQVKDFIPAQNLLNSQELRPNPVKRVTVSANASELSASISWIPDEDNKCVTYTIVRKERKAPTSVVDGTVVAKGLNAAYCKDISLRAGVAYYYAVFAVRENLVSNPTKCNDKIFLCSPLKKESIGYSLTDNSCTIHWTDQEESAGVRIKRCEVGSDTWSTVAERVHSPWTDKDLKMGNQYLYQLCTLWQYASGYCSSESVELMVNVLRRPNPVTIRLKSVEKDGTCLIEWDAATTMGEVELIRVNANTTVIKNQEYDVNVVRGMGQCLWTGSVSRGQIAIKLGVNQEISIACFCVYGTKRVAGNILEISTALPVEIDGNGIQLNGDRMELTVKNIDPNMTRIYCFVESVRNGIPHFATKEMALANQTDCIMDVDGQNEIVLIKKNVPLTKIAVTVIARYGQGTMARYSMPKTFVLSNQPKKKVSYSIEWAEKGFVKKKACRDWLRLTIRSEDGRIPHLCLYTREDGKPMWEDHFGDQGLVVLQEIQATDQKVVTYTLSAKELAGYPKNARVQLFLDPASAQEYEEPSCDTPSSLAMPD